MADIHQVKAAYERQLLAKRNVTFVGVGHKISHGVDTNRNAVVIGVARKIAKHELAADDLVPQTLDGVETDVIETGTFTKRIVAATALAPRAYNQKMRPCPAGLSCGHKNITAGTVGLWVGVNGQDGLYLLSNNHVIADENLAQVGEEILQPGSYDGGRLTDTIARLTAFMPIGYTHTNLVDAAIAEVYNPLDAMTSVHRLNAIRGLFHGDPLGKTVIKSGRTTETTKGVVAYVDVTVDVQYDGGIARFEDQLIITPGTFSAGGDSGSSIWTEEMELVGLLFAGSADYTVANQMGHVFRALDLYLKL